MTCDVQVVARDGTEEVEGLVPRPLCDEPSGLGEWVFWNTTALGIVTQLEAYEYAVGLQFGALRGWRPVWLYPAGGQRHAVRVEGRHGMARTGDAIRDGMVPVRVL